MNFNQPASFPDHDVDVGHEGMIGKRLGRQRGAARARSNRESREIGFSEFRDCEW
jgi:hypothetical protein